MFPSLSFHSYPPFRVYPPPYNLSDQPGPRLDLLLEFPLELLLLSRGRGAIDLVPYLVEELDNGRHAERAERNGAVESNDTTHVNQVTIKPCE